MGQHKPIAATQLTTVTESPLMRLEDLQTELQTLKPLLAREYHVAEIGVFGSVARDEQHDDSDVDLLVEFEAPVSLFDLVRLENELAERLGVEVDVVTKGSLRPRIGKRVDEDIVYV